MNIEPKINDILTTNDIIELRRRWEIPYMEMMRYLGEFRENLEKHKKGFTEDNDIDVDKEYEKEKNRLFKKGNKKIYEMGEKIDQYQWKLINKGV